MKRVLLTAAGSPAAQNFLACLRMMGEPLHVTACDANRFHLEWGDADQSFVSPLTSDPCYLPWLNALIAREGIEFVHGQADWEVAFLAEHAAELGAKTFYPRPEVVQLAQNKYASLLIWKRAGLVRAEPMLVPDNPRYRNDWPAGYPCWVRATRGAGSRGAFRADNQKEAGYWLWLMRRKGVEGQFMMEEYLPGREYAWHALFYRGELICSASREFVEKPTNLQLGAGGWSSSYVVARSTHDWKVNVVGERAVRALDNCPHGAYAVDMREDRDGILRPTECNAGRFKTTSLFLAAAGCNMPYWFVAWGLRGDREVWELPKLPQYDAVPEGLLWIRNMDVAPVLVREGELRAAPYVPDPTPEGV